MKHGIAVMVVVLFVEVLVLVSPNPAFQGILALIGTTGGVSHFLICLIAV